MATTLAELWKTGDGTPQASDIVIGGIGIDLVGKKMYSKNSSEVFEIGGSGLPDTDPSQKGKELATDGVNVGWSPIRMTPNIIEDNYTLPDGVSGSLTSGATIADTISITVPDGSTLSIV